MQITADSVVASTSARHRSAEALKDRLLGLTLMAIVPAVFWTAILASIGSLLGYAITFTVLANIAGAITIFLGCVCCAVTSRRA